MGFLNRTVAEKTIFILFLFAAVLCANCQRMEFSPIHADEELIQAEEGPDSLNFKTDKLDLVIAADTRKGMEPFLQSALTQFIESFQNYDVKAAYTNTSVSGFLIKAPSKKNKTRGGSASSEENEICSGGDWLFRIGAVAAGFHFTLPITFISGLQKTGDCIAQAGKAAHSAVGQVFTGGKKKYSAANGRFLPFENEGRKGEVFLTRTQDHYIDIFTETFTKGTANYNQFDAPSAQKGPSDPLAAALLTLIRDQGFFRDGSMKAVVVFTPFDTVQALDFSDIAETTQSIYGENSRIQIFPVSVTLDREVSCIQKLKAAGIKRAEPAVNLQNSVSDRVQPISLCAPDLTERLAKQIKQFVYPDGDIDPISL